MFDAIPHVISHSCAVEWFHYLSVGILTTKVQTMCAFVIILKYQTHTVHSLVINHILHGRQTELLVRLHASTAKIPGLVPHKVFSKLVANNFCCRIVLSTSASYCVGNSIKWYA